MTTTKPQQLKAEVAAQNDIADFLNKLAGIFGGGIGDFLKKIADFFDQLTAEQAQALQAESCWTGAISGLRQDLMENLANAISDTLLRLQEALACMLGGNVVQGTIDREMARQAIQAKFDLQCLWSAAMVYWQTRDAWKAAMAYMQCALGGGGGGGGTSGFQERPVNRC